MTVMTCHEYWRSGGSFLDEKKEDACTMSVDLDPEIARSVADHGSVSALEADRLFPWSICYADQHQCEDSQDR